MNTLRRALLVVLPVLLLAVAGVAVAIPPRITWNPYPLAMESIAVGEQATYTVVLTNTGYLPIPLTQQLRIVPEGAIAPYVTVTPPTFPKVFKRGDQVTVQVTVSVPTDAPVGVSNGTLVLKRVIGSRVLDVWRAEGLPMGVEVVLPTFDGGEELGFSIQYPPGWQVQTSGIGADFRGIANGSTGAPHYYMFIVYVRGGVNPDHLPIDIWLSQYLPDLQSLVVSTTTRSIDGYDALVVEAEGTDQYYTRILVPLENANIMEIVYGMETPELLPMYEAMVNSLQLTPPADE